MGHEPANKSAKKRKAVCALDLGAARVGVALTDDLGVLAHPRGALAARPRPILLEALRRLVVEENVGRIVVGFPLDLRGSEGEAARRALLSKRRFKRRVFSWKAG